MSSTIPAMQTNHTTSGLAVMSTHKYNFTDTNDWSLCSDNHPAFFFNPSKTGHVPFNMMRSVGYPVGLAFIAYNHENTTTLLQALERAGMVEVVTCSSMMGRVLYTDGGPAGFTSPEGLSCIKVPCNQMLPAGRPVGYGMVVREVPCGGTILSEGHLEKIFNHAMHILYTEGPCNSRGPGFSVDWYEEGRNFSSSQTSIDVRFFFNGYPVSVQLLRKKSPIDPCVIKILPDVTSNVSPPVVSRTSRWRYWNDDQVHDDDDDDYEGPCRDVEVWADDHSFVNVAKAHKLGWDVREDPRELERRRRVRAAVLSHRADEAAFEAAKESKVFANGVAFGQALGQAVRTGSVTYNGPSLDRVPVIDRRGSGPTEPPSAPKTRAQLNREKRDRKKRGLAARRQQAEEAAEETMIDITDMVAEGMRSMGLEVVINVGESKPPSAARKRWQTAIQRQIKINRHDKEATAKNKAASEERARVRAAAEAAKAAKKPTPFTPSGPSGPAPKPPEMPEEAPALSTKAKRKGKKLISLEKGIEHEEEKWEKEERRKLELEAQREARRLAFEIGGS